MSRHGKHVEHAAKHAPTAVALLFGNNISGYMIPTALTAAADFNGKLYAGLVDINKEYADFINRRLLEDFDFPQKLVGCKTPQDMFAVYSEFYRVAFGDYQREFAKLTEMGQSLAAETAEALQKRA